LPKLVLKRLSSPDILNPGVAKENHIVRVKQDQILEVIPLR